jgi:DNA-binding transcriptional LysR family regulator
MGPRRHAGNAWGCIVIIQFVDDVPDLELLALFHLLYRERHLTRAALRAGKSQPAMSRALGRLRGLLRDPLFVRSPAGMVPTPRADALAPEVERLLDQARAVVRRDAFEPRSLERTCSPRSRPPWPARPPAPTCSPAGRGRSKRRPSSRRGASTC